MCARFSKKRKTQRSKRVAAHIARRFDVLDFPAWSPDLSTMDRAYFPAMIAAVKEWAAQSLPRRRNLVTAAAFKEQLRRIQDAPAFRSMLAQAIEAQTGTVRKVIDNSGRVVA